MHYRVLAVALLCCRAAFSQNAGHPAWSHYFSADYAKAISICDSLLYINRSDSLSNYVRGLSYFHQGDYSRAVESLERVTSSQRFGAKAWYHISLSQSHSGLRTEALTSARNSLDNDPACMPCEVQLVRALAMLGRFEEAITEVEQSKSPFPLLALSERLVESKRCVEALDLLTRHSSLVDSTSDSQQLLIADALRCLGRLAEALEVYERLTLHARRRPEVLKRLGDTYGRIGKHELAITYLKLYLHASGDSTMSILSDVGRFYFAASKFDSAMVYFRKALDRDSTSSEAHYNLGLALYRLQRFKDATAAFEKSVLLSREALTTYERKLHSMAAAYSESGSRWKAIRTYRKLIGIDPNCHECWYRLGVLYEKVKDTTSAKESFQQFLKYAPRKDSYNEMRTYARERFRVLDAQIPTK